LIKVNGASEFYWKGPYPVPLILPAAAVSIHVATKRKARYAPKKHPNCGKQPQVT